MHQVSEAHPSLPVEDNDPSLIQDEVDPIRIRDVLQGNHFIVQNYWVVIPKPFGLW